jgi:hypothetical protein
VSGSEPKIIEFIESAYQLSRWQYFQHCLVVLQVCSMPARTKEANMDALTSTAREILHQAIPRFPTSNSFSDDTPFTFFSYSFYHFLDSTNIFFLALIFAVVLTNSSKRNNAS